MKNIQNFNAFFEGIDKPKKIDITKNKAGYPNYEAYCLIADHKNTGNNFKEYSGIHSMYKTDYGLLIKSNGGDEIKVTKDSLKFNDDNAFIYSHYTKQMSKFYRDAQVGEYFYNLIQEHFPDNNIAFITPETLKKDGWRQSKITELRLIEDNKIYMLYDNNCELFIKDDKYYMIFDFNEYKLKVYDSMELQEHIILPPTIYPGKIIKEMSIRNKKDYQQFLNSFNN
jgi:hypothetical protein